MKWITRGTTPEYAMNKNVLKKLSTEVMFGYQQLLSFKNSTLNFIYQPISDLSDLYTALVVRSFFI